MAASWKAPIEESIKLIDSQHSDIFEMSTRYFSALDRQDASLSLENMVRMLLHFLRLHLEVEEGLMRRVAYPDAAAHHEGHASLMDKIAAVSGALDHGHVGALDVRALMDAFVQHHDHADRPLMAFIHRRLAEASAPAPASARHLPAYAS